MIRLLIILCITIFSGQAFGQITAAFSTNNTSGCAPLVNQFTNQSTATSGITLAYSWDDGTNSSTLQNPTFVYATPGTYVITLTAYDQNNSSVFDTETLSITVYNKPSVSFTKTPTSGCAPLEVQFNSNASSAGSGTITSRFWDFGDGYTGSSTNPSHTYTSGGNFTPSLKITNSFGCHKTVSASTSVVVSSGPNAAFSSSNSQACAPPLTVNFSSTTSGGNTPYSYQWDLDVSTSTNQNPSATYVAAGFYDIRLIVTDNAGCKDTATSDDYVIITAVDADFDVESPACKGEPISIENNSVGASTYTWSWGDNTAGSGSAPSKAYSAGGTYTITLLAVSGNCSDSYTETIQIQEITTSFTTLPTYHCQQPFITNYTNTSTVNFGSIASHEWRWGINDDPILSQIDTNEVDSIIRDYDDLGYFDDTLIVVSNLGCTAQLVKPDNVFLEVMTAAFSTDSLRGCAPITVDFMDASTPTTLYPINSWSWDFGNGATSNVQNPQNISYVDTGCYQIKLIITNTYGCIDSLVTQNPGEGVCYGSHPTAEAIWYEDSLCSSDSMWFFNVWNDSFANEFYWNFSDGTWVEGDSVHVTFVDTGWINLEYIVGHHGCMDTVYYDSVAYVKGPIVEFLVNFDCDTPMTRWITPISFDGVERFYWDFGDNSPIDSVNQSPIHTYAQSGTYNITLTAFNDTYGCEDEYIVTVAVRNLVTDFEIGNFGANIVDSVACLPASFSFDAGISVDESSQYQWFINNDTIEETVPNTSYYFTESGHYEIRLMLHDANGCIEEKVRNVFVSDPTPNFTYSYTGGCDPVSIQFNDNSSSDTNISQWTWAYGDGTFDTNNLNPIHEFATAGGKPVTLSIVDSIGCTASRTKIILIKFPYVDFELDSIACELSTVSVFNQSVGDSLTYFWNFGNNVTNTVKDPPGVIYTAPGEYQVYLAIEDDLGCKDTVYKDVSVKEKPKANFTADTTFAPCLPLLVTLQDSSQGDSIVTWLWDFGDGSGSVLFDSPTAQHVYNLTGAFDVTLTVTTKYGCTSTRKKSGFIEVDGPYAIFGVAPDSACIGTPVKFFVEQKLKLGKYLWAFGDGYVTTVSGNVDTITHEYERVGHWTPAVVYYDDLELCSVTQLDSVYIHEVQSDFSFTPDSVGCGRLNVTFLNEGLGADIFRWDLGQGETSGANSPRQYYPSPGEYEVELYVEDLEFGCKDSITKLFVVHPVPDVEAGDDSLICFGDSLTIFGESSIDSLDWYWKPARFVEDDSSWITKAFPDTTRYMKIHAIDTNGCIGVDSVLVTVQDTPRVDIFDDTVVVIGDVLVLDPRTNDNITYEWLPPNVLSCNDCPYPTYRAMSDQDVILIARDIYGCFEKEFTFRIRVEEKYSLDVPDAFSPNGDGVNDVIYARGWGVKELLEFTIYNRWGQEVFSTNSLHEGWDGNYRGKAQGMDTYAYIVKVERFSGDESTIEGFIELIR